jgi:hypothetical protein
VPPALVLCSGYIADAKSPRPVGLVSRAISRGVGFGPGEIVFLDVDQTEALAPGAQFSVIRPGDPVVHPRTGRRVGPLVETVATVTVEAIEARLVRARIVQACGQVHLGDALIPARPLPVPVRTDGEAAAPIEGTLIAARDRRVSTGAEYIAYIDLGADQGIAPGDLFAVYRPPETARLRGDSPFRPQREAIPPTPIGEVMVVRTSARSSTVLITRSAEDLSVGLRVFLSRKAGPGAPK